MQHASAAGPTHGRASIVELLLLVLCAAGTFLILLWVIKFSHYGIDFSDESYYLVSMANPFLYDWSVTQFGFIYHPLYVILDGDVARLRQVNIGLVFGLSWVLVDLLLKAQAPTEVKQTLTRLIIGAGFAVASLIVFDSWLVTPSYNSLALQGVLVTLIGCLLAERVTSWKSASGWVLIGIGGWLAFMAKPSTALALAFITFCYLFSARKFDLRKALISIGCTLTCLVVGALLIDGSVLKFLDRLKIGLTFASYLGGGHTVGRIIRLDELHLSGRERNSLLVLAALVFLALWRSSSRKLVDRALAIMIQLFFAGAVLALSLGWIHKSAGFREFQDMLIWAIVWPSVLLGVMAIRQNKQPLFPSIHWGLALSLLAMPHVYALGTNRNYWQAGGSAAIFWVLFGVVFIGPVARIRKGWGFALPLVLGTQAVSATLLQTGLERPYRQAQPLRLNRQTVEFGQPGANLVLSEEYARYIKEATGAARSAGLQVGTPLIDMTGQSPGVLYALRAMSIAQPWIIGGYPGSKKLAGAALIHVSCEQLSSAWLLREPGGPRQLDDDLLATYGGKLADHFTQVASWQTAEGVGGYTGTRTQILYRPVRSADVAEACRAIKDRELF